MQRFELAVDEKLTHEMIIPLRWGDMDALGHVNNTLYFRFIQIVRLEWLFSVDVTMNLRAPDR